MTSEQIHSFCCDLKGNSDETKPMICDLLEGNDYKPVIANEIEHGIAKCHMLMDHDHHETMSPEVNHCSSCTRQKLYSILGNECKPFDNNFCVSHVISHSVLIAPENNSSSDQISHFAADYQEKP